MTTVRDMSFYRENVIWKSMDGTWSIGFYKTIWTGEDPEWDVIYDYDHFEWVSTGHRSEESANSSWKGANPGGGEVIPSGASTKAERKRLDNMAESLQHPERARERELREMKSRIRNHRRQLREFFDGNSLNGVTVHVELAEGDDPTAEVGAFTHIDGIAHDRDGNIVVDDVVIFSKKTRRVHPHLHKVSIEPRRRWF